MCGGRGGGIRYVTFFFFLCALCADGRVALLRQSVRVRNGIALVSVCWWDAFGTSSVVVGRRDGGGGNAEASAETLRRGRCCSGWYFFLLCFVSRTDACAEVG